MAGLYIHVPFCSTRCAYCAFYSTTYGDEVKTAYVGALCKEMSSRCHEFRNVAVSTVYLGGGTPSLLNIPLFNQLFSALRTNFNVSPHAEITVEANPDDLSVELVRCWVANGVNRVSLGIQSLNDHILKSINRRHDAAQAISAVHLLWNEGVKNISIDLIYALPGQTLQDWDRNLDIAVGLPITHLSAYALSIEEGTYLFRLLQKGIVSEVSDGMQCMMYRRLVSKLSQTGFQQYEISNFSRSGMESQHNSSYWKGEPYIGLGPGAHSFDGRNVRRCNQPDVMAYIACSGNPPMEMEVLDVGQSLDEYILTSLRTKCGLSLQKLSKLTSSNNVLALLRKAYHYQREGMVVIHEGHISFTTSGFLMSDALILEFSSVME